jgi:DNA-binding transcriptional regulator YbjK
MASPDTRTQILDAAERLFAEHGFRGTSVRAITDLAGANLAAVGYHEMPADDEGAARTSRLIVTIFGDPAEEMRNWTGPAEDTVRDRSLAAFGRALPGAGRSRSWRPR